MKVKLCLSCSDELMYKKNKEKEEAKKRYLEEYTTYKENLQKEEEEESKRQKKRKVSKLGSVPPSLEIPESIPKHKGSKKKPKI